METAVDCGEAAEPRIVYSVYSKQRLSPGGGTFWALKSGYGLTAENRENCEPSDLARRIGVGVERLFISFCPASAVIEHFARSEGRFVGIGDVDVIEVLERADWHCAPGCGHPKPVGVDTEVWQVAAPSTDQDSTTTETSEAVAHLRATA